MSDLDHEIQRGLERLTGPRGGADHPTVEKLAERRRQRRVRRTAATVVPAVALVVAVGVVGATALGSGDTADVAVGAEGMASGPDTSEPQPDTTRPEAVTEPGTHTLDEAEAAKEVVSAFLDDVRAGDLEAAAERWTGYPELGPEAPVDERIPYIEELLARLDFPRIVNQDDTEMFVTPSLGGDPVVTVLAPPPHRGRDLAVAAAFMMDAASSDAGGPMRIQRLPQMDFPRSEGVVISYFDHGDEVEITGLVPVEGGARAFVDDTEVPITIDHDAVAMTITLPDDFEGDAAVTLSIATPEEPRPEAFSVHGR